MKRMFATVLALMIAVPTLAVVSSHPSFHPSFHATPHATPHVTPHAMPHQVSHSTPPRIPPRAPAPRVRPSPFPWYVVIPHGPVAARRNAQATTPAPTSSETPIFPLVLIGIGIVVILLTAAISVRRDYR